MDLDITLRQGINRDINGSELFEEIKTFCTIFSHTDNVTSLEFRL